MLSVSVVETNETTPPPRYKKGALIAPYRMRDASLVKKS